MTPLPIVVSTRASVVSSTPSSSIVVSSQPGILVAPSTSSDISHSHGSSGFKVTIFMTFFEFSMFAMSVIIVPFIDLLNLNL